MGSLCINVLVDEFNHSSSLAQAGQPRFTMFFMSACHEGTPPRMAESAEKPAPTPTIE